MVAAAVVAASAVGAQFAAKPWPSYSLQNMPRTAFTCRGKILGGYYADAETQCQMFHVCVKVAGVGVSVWMDTERCRTRNGMMDAIDFSALSRACLNVADFIAGGGPR